MILTKEVEIKLNAQNIRHYRDLGYKCNPHDKICVKIEHLSKGSNYKVEVRCDKCGKEKKLTYHKYIRNINIGGFYSCSNKCSIEKNEEKCLKKYGIKNYMQTNEFRVKSKNTKKEKYSDENYNNQEKLRKTNLKKYGVENIFQFNDIKEKMKKTFLEKYGTEYYTQTQEHKNHIKSLNIDYSIRQEKMKKTCLERYGYAYSAQNIDIYTKTQKTQLKIKYYKNIKYQGTYELDFLIFCDNIGILQKLTKVKSLKYTHEFKNKIYHPDFFIQELNLIIEIKSDYYYNLYLEKNICKQKSCFDQKYDFIFIINKDYDKFLEKIKAII